MKYPHSFTVDPGYVSDQGYLCAICGCGRTVWFLVGAAQPAEDNCPASMLRHIAELERLQTSIIKARAEAYKAGRADEMALHLRPSK